jgi:hypothetical protein
MSCRVALIDSCGLRPDAIEAASFQSVGTAVERAPPLADPTGHGSRIADLLCAGEESIELLLGQVFSSAAPTTAAAVAAALDWALERGAALVHLSLGLAADREVLRAATARAVACGSIIVAATPARGAPAYPASYPGVIRASSDARCAPGELSRLGESHFGGCPRLGGRGGASIGAAWVSKAIIGLPRPLTPAAAVHGLSARSAYLGPERTRGRVPPQLTA